MNDAFPIVTSVGNIAVEKICGRWLGWQFNTLKQSCFVQRQRNVKCFPWKNCENSRRGSEQIRVGVSYLGEIRRSDYSAIITKDLYLVNINITLRDSVGGCAQWVSRRYGFKFRRPRIQFSGLSSYNFFSLV